MDEWIERLKAAYDVGYYRTGPHWRVSEPAHARGNVVSRAGPMHATHVGRCGRRVHAREDELWGPFAENAAAAEQSGSYQGERCRLSRAAHECGS
jgi:hypothetical protein